MVKFASNKQNELNMKKQLFVWAAILFVSISVSAQKRFEVYAVGFYNQENLFDTCHDEGKKDYDFLPNGSYHWDGLRYKNKLQNMAQALHDMGTDVLPNIGCAMIGMAEVENDNVLNDLINEPKLKERGYKYVHIEGPDKRGIDCALLYNPSLFTVKDSHLYPYIQHLDDIKDFVTRGFLTINGTLAGEDVTVIVCHWPSRFNGSAYREQGAKEVKELKDSLMKVNPGRKLFVMGDMNDDPTNKSMHEVLSAKAEINEVGDGDMYNPWYNILAKDGKGTLMYRGSWNLFDQIVMTPNLLNRNGKKDYSSLKFWKNQIQRMPYLIQSEGQYKGGPKRTTAGGTWLNGYSDHLPVVVYLVKEKK